MRLRAQGIGRKSPQVALRPLSAQRRISSITYRQLVFTIPRNLRRAFLFDRSLYGDFCRIAYASTGDFLRRQAAGQFYGVEKAVPAMVASPQSFGDLIVQQPRS